MKQNALRLNNEILSRHIFYTTVPKSFFIGSDVFDWYHHVDYFYIYSCPNDREVLKYLINYTCPFMQNEKLFYTDDGDLILIDTLHEHVQNKLFSYITERFIEP